MANRKPTPKPAPAPVRDATHKPLLRQTIRQVLARAVERKFTDAMLLTSVQMVGVESTEEELREALLWNQSSGYVDYRYNRDAERDEWYLTERGKAKEGLK
jgi:hypothetical protein